MFSRYFILFFSDRFSLPETVAVGDPTLIINVYNETSAEMLLESVVLPKHPKDIPGLNTPVKIVVESIRLLYDSVAQITLRSDRLALFVVLTTRAQGRFSENAFVLRPMQRKVRSIFFALSCHDHLQLLVVLTRLITDDLS